MAMQGKTTWMPKLRFPEFRARVDWSSILLSEASIPITERVGGRKLTPVSISAGVGFVPQAEKFGRDISGNQYALYTLVRDGDFVYNKGNSLTFPQGCVYQLRGWGEVAAPNVFIAFRLKSGFVAEYFQYCFEKNIHGSQLKKHITSGARSNGLLNLSREQFFGAIIPTPEQDEQQKIADCLTSLDEVIAAQGQKVEALKTFKRGLMQQLFPGEGETFPRLRFPEFRNEPAWSSLRIADLNPFVTSGSRGWASYYADQGALFVRITNLSRDSIQLDLTDCRFVALPEDQGEGVRTQLKAHDVLISITADIGIIGYVDSDTPTPAYINQHIALVRFKGAQVFGKFVAYFLASDESQRGILAATDNGTKAGMNLSAVQNLKLLLPALPEQQRISAYLSTVDAEITNASNKFKALRSHKKGLMQQIFPAMSEV